MRLKPNQTNKKFNSQAGQTLIEVIVALFMLTMALVAGLGLAIYSSTRNVNNRNLTIANNLAREGVEAVRVLRDTNWLAASDPTPSGITSGVAPLNPACTFPGGVTLPCYPEGFRDPYDIESTSNNNRFRLVFLYNGTSPIWRLDARNGLENYLLCLQSDGTYQPGTCTPEEAQFARKVTITTGNTSAPFTSAGNNPTAAAGHSPEKIVSVTVVWKGKGCAEFDQNMVPTTFVTKCKTTVVERLTNWKDYR